MKIIVVFCSILMFISCDSSTSLDNPVPGKVQFVEKSADTDFVETGIDAMDGSSPNQDKNGIYIEWHPVDDEDLIAYDLYRSIGDSTSSFQRIKIIQQSFGAQDTSYLDLDVELNIRYFYHVIARDEAAQESDRSVNEFYLLLEKPTINFPDGGQQIQPQTDIVFDWTFNSIDINNFIFRLEQQVIGGDYEARIVEDRIVQGNVDPHQQLRLSQLNLTTLDPGPYRWRIEVVTSDKRQGAEATWASFRIE